VHDPRKRQTEAPPETGHTAEDGPRLDVVRQAYGWTFDKDGQLHGLISGDMGYEPAGMWLDHRTKVWADNERKREDEIDRLKAEVQRLTAERDAAREQFDTHVAWASEQEQQARAETWAVAVARLTEQVREWRAEAEAAGDRARAECALRREVEAERDASLATATEAAETVARLTAERDAERAHYQSTRWRLVDAARAQVWAEAIAVAQTVRYPDGMALSHSGESFNRGVDAVLAALRAAQERQG